MTREERISLDQYKLDTLWEAHEERQTVQQKDKGFSLASLVSTPERIVLVLILMSQGLISADTLKQFLSIVIGAK